MAGRQARADIAARKAAENRELVKNVWVGRKEIVCPDLKKVTQAEVDAYVNKRVWEAAYTVNGKGQGTTVSELHFHILLTKH